MSVPGQRIGYNGPSCLGMIGLAVLSFVFVLGVAWLIWVRFGPFLGGDDVRSKTT